MQVHDHRLVLVDGPDAGTHYALQPGAHLAGRGTDADLRLPFAGLSRDHAWLRRDGDAVSIADAGSTNGTRVNGEPVEAPRRLRGGDVIDLGGVRLRYEEPEATAVHRVANHVGRDNHGILNMAGRDVHYSHAVHNRFTPDEPLDELFHGRGAGRALMALGLVVCLAGFAAFAGLILSGFGSFSDPSAPSPFERELLGVPAFAIAFGTFAIGGIVGQIGASMSRAARDRERRLS